MFVIHQGDDLMIPFEIAQNSTPIKPEDVLDVRICIGNIVRSYSKGELIYYDNAFLFHLTNKDSAKMLGLVECQLEIKYNSNEIHSQTIPIKFAKTQAGLL